MNMPLWIIKSITNFKNDKEKTRQINGQFVYVFVVFCYYQE